MTEAATTEAGETLQRSRTSGVLKDALWGWSNGGAAGVGGGGVEGWGAGGAVGGGVMEGL